MQSTWSSIQTIHELGLSPCDPDRISEKMNHILPLQKGFLNTSCGPIKESEDESNMEELDLPTDFKDLPARIDWDAELPANIVVPGVDIHSLILDFAAVSFLDISALKGLKTVC